ncbi:MAG: tRNA (adenosine(37)-N6)-threonylcarbamoyltransferase complex ATPase subunit type 1 TsaE [Bacteroidetes bacterium]|nr:tRNA (adenosine(37)-N6)-threonylcarbamoyltransferase complex ATPase subunit type 1 TsaE [Bacteroidota bacterium]
MPKYLLSSIENTREVAKTLANLVKESRIMTFSGNLGTGKTTTIQEICKALGVSDFVSSPSFGLVNEYQNSDEHIFHFDLYRMNSLDEALDIGFLEYLDSGSICLIEWPEVVLDLLPEEGIRVSLNHEEDGKRSISW